MAKSKRERVGLLEYLEKRMGSSTGYGPEYQFYCPFCIDREGDESTKRKLRLNTTKGKCKCFRCGYGASNLEKLFRNLNGGALRIEELILIKGEQVPPERSTLKSVVLDILYADSEVVNLKPYELPKSCVRLSQKTKHKATARVGWNYLIKRRKIHERMVDIYDIRYCYAGDYENRLIFPVYHAGTMVYWVNRFCGDHPLKCKNPPNQEGHHSKDTVILNYDDMVGAKIVGIVEGAFDMLAHKHAGALGGKSISAVQVELLAALTQAGTEEFVISLDSDAMRDAEKIYDKLLGRVPKVTILPLGYGDPDERREELPELMVGRRSPTVRDRVCGRLGRL